MVRGLRISAAGKFAVQDLTGRFSTRQATLLLGEESRKVGGEETVKSEFLPLSF
jgi:hypothetical protein